MGLINRYFPRFRVASVHVRVTVLSETMFRRCRTCLEIVSEFLLKPAELEIKAHTAF